MTSATVLCASLAVLLLINFSVSDAATRVARSSHFGGSSQARAQSSAGGFGGGLHHPGFGGGFGRPSIGRPGIGSGGSVSIAKSISISRGGAGVAQSSAKSAAVGK